MICEQCSDYNPYGVCMACGTPCNHTYNSDGFCDNCGNQKPFEEFCICTEIINHDGDSYCDECGKLIPS